MTEEIYWVQVEGATLGELDEAQNFFERNMPDEDVIISSGKVEPIEKDTLIEYFEEVLEELRD